MNFNKATDGLFDRVSHDDLAEVLRISVASIRQARLSPDAEAHRTPPQGWEKAVLRLARQREGHFRRLADELEKLLAREG